MHDQIGIAADGRGEMRVGAGGEREVSFVDLGVPRPLERPQHEVRKNALLWLAGDFLRELLVHARGDVDVFGNLDRLCAASAAVALSLVAAQLHALDGQRAYSK